jgi:23S rRNA (guanosine2251-2'-O)-methyltransferase
MNSKKKFSEKHSGRPFAKKDQRKASSNRNSSRRPEPVAGTRSETEENLIIKGRHEVLNALEAGQNLEAVFISSGFKGGLAAKVRELASAAKIPVKEVPSEVFEKKFGDKSQGIAATAGAFAYTDFEELVEKALAGSQVLVALNQVEDPRNLGAIVRTVEASGCSGIVIPKHRSAGMTEWAIRTAQGAAAHLPVARVTNLADSIEKLKEKGFWIIGLDGAADKIFTEVVYSGPVLLVAGGEDVGLGERVKKCCDELVAIPLKGKTTSLNVSVSTAVVLYEICRQKDFFQNN